MRFAYHPQAGESELVIEGEAFAHLFKARRHREGEQLTFRTLLDQRLFVYSIETLDRRRAALRLVSSREEPMRPTGAAHLAWCVVDPKVIERTLPFLNELGVRRLTLLWCEKSQRSFRLDTDRMARIVIASCEQSGRSEPMAIEVAQMEGFLAEYPQAALLDFGGQALSAEALGDRVLIVGPEGGFGCADRTLFADRASFGLPGALVLRSETGMIAAASLLL